MRDLSEQLESGERFALRIPGLPYPLHLPWVWLPGDEQDVRIASLNLIGQVRWNQDIGKLLATRVRSAFPEFSQLCLMTVVEKALQLAQVVASELGMADMAVAYNRVKPHMEASGRPVIQVGADSITSGEKYLALYERDINLLTARASGGVILIDDVVTTGGTALGLVDLLDQVTRLTNLPRPIPLRGVFCVAEEGKRTRVLPAPVHSLARLPDPLVRAGSRKSDALQGKLWPRPRSA
jgi:adenine phosphoribosyltransferase